MAGRSRLPRWSGNGMADALPNIDAPLSPEERLDCARSLEGRGQHGDALLAYYRAIIEAQRLGRWLDQATTASALVAGVTHAMRYVKAGRRRPFEQVLEPVFARHGRAALARFEACLAIQVGVRRAAPPDPRQQPSMLYYPGLPAAPYFERSLFPWIAELERQTEAIREELRTILPQAGSAERVFVSDEAERRGLAGGIEAPSWNGFYFFRHGAR